VTGLTSSQAAARLAEDGPNLVVPAQQHRWWRTALETLSDPTVLLLLIAIPTYLVIGEASDAVVTAAALFPIAGVSWYLERRTERTLEQLRRLTAPTATVVRDDQQITIDAESVVCGDVMVVHEGDVIAADAQVLEVSQLEADESALTGESFPVSKTPGSTLLAGTTVLSGRAQAVVTATGARTEYGTVGALVATVHTPSTPLQRMVRRMVLLLGAAAAVFCIAILLVEVLRGNGWGDGLIAGVSLAIAAVPEEFPMVYTLYLALGAARLSRHHALVRRLPGVETLGSTSVICTDKTGTLTHGRLDVAALRPTDGVSETELLHAAVLACEPHPYDPLDVAIVAHARALGIDVDGLLAQTLVVDHPFDPTDKYLTHVWADTNGDHRVAAKGALEGILLHSSAAPEVTLLAQQTNHNLASTGMRVIAVASGAREATTASSRLDDEEPLRYLGLIGFHDAIRDGVAEALAECQSAGIRVVMITGDHPVTAHAVAEGLDLPHVSGTGEDLITTGADLDAADDDRFRALARETNVFARIRPEQKHRLVAALRADGDVVAMTGDGINDAPALREADIGVAMGARGTAVAREAATLVLLDDNFATIVHAVRDGRRIFDNLQRAFAYLVAFHIPLLITAMVVPLANRPLLLLPVHLLLLEVVLHPAVSLVFQADPAAPDVMQRPPRPRAVGLLSRALVRPVALGLTLSAATLTTYLVAVARNYSEDRARGTAFCLLLLGQMLLLIVERSPHAPVWRGPRPTPTLWWVLVAFAALTAAGAYFAPFANLLSIDPPHATDWIVVVIAAVASTLWSEPIKSRLGRT
jgi:Ca2+-transporting ATPase